MPLVIALTFLCLLLGGFDWLSEKWEDREARKRRQAWEIEQRRQRAEFARRRRAKGWY
jgi:hypothetical protein